MVVGDDEVVDLGQVCHVEDLRPSEEGVHYAEGCTFDKYGIDEVTHSIHLQEVARVPKPYNQVFGAIELL